jgi:uncharacterized protein (DUF433 family)
MAQDTITPPDLGRISQDPAVMVGKPVIRGTRIPVELVLGKLSYAFDLDELFAAYPDLTLDDVKAALAFAQKSVDADYRRSRRKAGSVSASKR